jgi:hypothetical protein
MSSQSKIYFILFICLFFREKGKSQQAISPIFAKQFKALQQNKNISWIGESEIDFRLLPEGTFREDEHNFVTVLKMMSPDFPKEIYENYSFDLNEWIYKSILEDLIDGKYICYRDEELKEAINVTEIKSIFTKVDTLSSCEEPYTQHTITDFFSASDIAYLRLVFLLYYNQKEEQFGTLNLTYSVLEEVRSEEMDTIIGYTPKLWAIVPSDESNHSNHFKNDNLNYIIQTETKDNSPIIANFINLKGNLDIHKIITQEIKTPEKCLNNENFKPENLTNLTELINPMDTVEIENPLTKKDSISLVSNHFNERLTRLKLVHLWYYDNKKHQLYCRLTAISPLKDILDDDGSLRYRLPLYYKKTF